MDRARRGGTNSADHVVHGVVFVSTRRLDQAEHGDESPKASDILYIKAPAAPFTVNGEHTELRPSWRPKAAIARRCWPSSPKRALTLTFSLLNSRRKARSRCEILERIDVGNRIEERRAQASRLTLKADL